MKSNKMVVLLAGLLIFSLVISGCSSKSEQAVANLNNAQKNFNRVKKMYKKNVISESDYDSTNSTAPDVNDGFNNDFRFDSGSCWLG